MVAGSIPNVVPDVNSQVWGCVVENSHYVAGLLHSANIHDQRYFKQSFWGQKPQLSEEINHNKRQNLG